LVVVGLKQLTSDVRRPRYAKQPLQINLKLQIVWILQLTEPHTDIYAI